MALRPYKVRKKISATMQGTSNFAGKEHTIGSKAKISDRRGSYNPIGTKKWFVHGDTAKTLRKTQNPGGLFRRGRTVKENQMKSFIEYVVEDHAMVKKMSDEHPEARFRTNPLKPTMSMKDRMAQKKNLSNLLKKRMNEGKLKDMVTGHMDTGKGMSYDAAVKKAEKDLDKMKKPTVTGLTKRAGDRQVHPDAAGVGMLMRRGKMKGMKTEASHPSKADLKMIDKMYDDKGKQTSFGNEAMRRAIANVNRKAQDKINQRTAKAKADSKPR